MQNIRGVDSFCGGPGLNLELFFQKSFDKEVSEAMLTQAEPGSMESWMETVAVAEQRGDLYTLSPR